MVSSFWFKGLLGSAALAALSVTLLVGVVLPASGASGAGTPNGCTGIAATGQAGSTTTCSRRPSASAVVQWATRMADALYVNPACGSRRGGDCNDTWYMSAFPQEMIAYGQHWCQAHGDCADWANGSSQCVSFVRGAYSQVYPMKLTNDAFGLWATYQGQPGWQEIPAAATADVG